MLTLVEILLIIFCLIILINFVSVLTALIKNEDFKRNKNFKRLLRIFFIQYFLILTVSFAISLFLFFQLYELAPLGAN
jgi:NADH:ubiquinone oxidoreductase subunit 4 (subunit M)